ncbi:MAG: hypothetical protein HY327_05045 [Chloroflexi bacterium]|nr:hypothetical protein [Chloroflexota bacterium]
MVRHTHGVLSMAALAREKRFDSRFVPSSDAPEASLIPNLNVFPIETLFALVAHLNGMQPIAPYRPVSDFSFDATQRVSGISTVFDFFWHDCGVHKNVRQAYALPHVFIITGSTGAGCSVVIMLPSC